MNERITLLVGFDVDKGAVTQPRNAGPSRQWWAVINYQCFSPILREFTDWSPGSVCYSRRRSPPNQPSDRARRGSSRG